LVRSSIKKVVVRVGSICSFYLGLKSFHPKTVRSLPMTIAEWGWRGKVWATTTIAFSGILVTVSDPSLAQVVPDDTLGNEGSRVTPLDQQNDRIDGGALRGTSLFHSFQDFGVEAERGVYFSNPAGVENIFSRVTGNTSSNIYGTLGVQGNANLFLLNPNGILFGSNSRLDLRGSFVASTANSLVLPDGSRFSAASPGAPPLLEVNVTAPIGLQFEGEQPGLIVNAGTLQVDPEQNLTLAGGTVVSTGELSAPGGDIAVLSVQGGGIDQVPLVNLSQEGQLLGQTVVPRSTDGVRAFPPTMSLPEVITEWGTGTGLAVAPSGQVELVGSGLPVEAGDVAVRQLNAETAMLLATNNLTLVESQLETTGDMHLLAQDTVQVRDSEVNPFVASAGGELLVQGNQGIDIFALNHPNSGLFSGRDMVLRSANAVGGDAHYWSGGNFRIEQLDGNLGNLFSPYDPIIRASGNVEFDSYRGASLHIFAGGSVKINGTVTITGSDTTSQSIREDVTLSNRETVVSINGSAQPTLDIRAGTTAFNPTGIVGNPNGFTPDPPNTNGTGTSADITISEIVNNGGTVFLTNLYQPNLALPGGTIQVDSINTSISAAGSGIGGSVFLDARSDITLFDSNRDGRHSIDASNYSNSGGDAGDVTLIAGNTISLTNHQLITQVEAVSGNGGEVRLVAGGGVSFSDEAFINTATTGSGDSGNVAIESEGPVSFINASIRSETSGAGNSGDVTIRAPNSRIYFEGDPNPNTEEGTFSAEGIFSGSCRFADRCYRGQSFVGRSGNVELIANSVDFTNRAEVVSSIQGQGDAGNITIHATDSVSFTNGARILADTLSSGDAGDITVTAGNSISFDGISEINEDRRSSGAFSRSRLAAKDEIAMVLGTVPPPEGNGGRIELSARDISLSNSARISADAEGLGNGGDITIQGTSSVAASGAAQLDSSTSGSGNGGNITIQNTGSVSIATDAQLRSGTSGSGRGGDIFIQDTGSVAVSGGAQLRSGTSGSGHGGNVTISAEEIAVGGEGSRIDSSSGTQSGCSDVQCNGGDIQLRARTINLSDHAEVSAATQGDGDGGNITIQGSGQNSGAISVSGNAQLNSSTSGSGTGGAIRIQDTGSVDLAAGAQLNSGTSVSGRGGDILIQDTGSVAFNSGAQLNSSTLGTGDGGNVTIDVTDSVRFRSGAQVIASTSSSGRGGNIAVQANNAISLIGQESSLLSQSLNSANTSGAGGRGGNIRLNAGFITVSNQAQVSANTETSGDGGRILIGLPDPQGSPVPSTNSISVSDRSQINSGTSGSGTGGNVSIQNADSVTISDRARINSGTSGSGTGGNVSIQNADSVTISDRARINVATERSGNAGNITIQGSGQNTGAISVSGNARLNSSTSGSGTGGAITIQDTGSVDLAAGAQLNSSTLGTGDGGNVTINVTDSVRFRTGAQVIASTSSSGRGGNIAVQANNTISLIGQESSLLSQSLNSANTPGSGGRGGDIRLNAGSISVSDRARINSGTSGSGTGGDVSIQNANSVSISDRAQINASTSGSGRGGNITIRNADSVVISDNPNVTISDRAQLNAGTSGAGIGGNVIIQADTASVSRARITVEASESGNAGNINTSVNSITLDNHGEITAESQKSQGGNIYLQANNYVLMRRGSSISALSDGRGSSDGRIRIPTGVIAASPLEDSDVLARSERNGRIDLNATLGFQIQQGLEEVGERSDITGTGGINVNLNVDPSSGLTPLPEEPDSPEISNTCQVGGNRNTAEFYNVGRGGTPPRPDEPLNANTLNEDWISLEPAGSSTVTENVAPSSNTQIPALSSQSIPSCQSL
jgi:filamentous hemagglutinin family protein